MLKSFAVLCGGDYGGVIIARKFPVAAREVDRRVLIIHVSTDVGLRTCVRSRIRQAARHSTPVSRGAGGSIWSSPKMSIGRDQRTGMGMKRQEGNE